MNERYGQPQTDSSRIIPIGLINNPYFVAEQTSNTRRKYEGKRKLRQPVVVPDNGRYELVSGSRALAAAREDGLKGIECFVRSNLSPQEHEELNIIELYECGTTPPTKMGRIFQAYRDTHDVTQQELARRTGISAGAIHHYESLIKTLDPFLGQKLDLGELTFKEARAIADILDHERQREVAVPFLNGELSSINVEGIVKRAKEIPYIPISQAIREALEGTTEREDPIPETSEISEPKPAEQGIEADILRLAGEIDSLRLQRIPEHHRLKLISSLRVLQNRVKITQDYLNKKQMGYRSR